MPKIEYEVVWSGRDSLLPDRDERWDNRYSGMPSYDIDDGDVAKKPKRAYKKSGKFKGRFSRTDPNAKQFRPKGGAKNS